MTGGGREVEAGAPPAPPVGEVAPRRVLSLRVALGAAVVLLQVAVMLAAFTPAPHPGGDNAGYLALAHSILERGAYVDLWDPAEPPHTKYPPGYPLLLAGLALLGARSWVAFKGVSALATTLAVLFAYLWASERRGPWFGAGVVVILALSDAFLYSSNWILSDPPFVALTFLALWAFERAEPRGAEVREGDPRAGTRWIAVGVGAAVLAYFTRSAGLPLVAAAGLWLALRKRWRALALLALAFGLPALLWSLRTGAAGGDAYLEEFWLVDPYQPALGRAGPAELAGRVAENLRAYVTVHVPGGLAGLRGRIVALGGVLVTGLAAAGWWRWLRRRAGVSEIFVPLYAGLVLLWPAVWAGDRFALALFPVILFHAGTVVVDVARRVHARAAAPAGALAVLVLAVPASLAWWFSVGDAAACVRVAAVDGPWGCHRPRLREFVASAHWSGENLPDGAVVLSRKPRIFYVVGGVKSRTFPLTPDPVEFLAEAEAAGARYVVMDYLDNLGAYYLLPVLEARPGRFCSMAGFGAAGGEVRTELLGILPGAEDPGAEMEVEEGTLLLSLLPCPADMTREAPRVLPPLSSPDVYVLASREP